MFKIGDFVDGIIRNINEQTTSSAIAYLPGGFLKAKKALHPLARMKKNWGVTVIEGGEGYKVSFEDVIEFGIPDKKTYEEFNNKVVKVHGMTIVSLDKILNEALDTFKETAFEDLEFTLTKRFSSIDIVSNAIDLVNAWYRSFPNTIAKLYPQNVISVSKYTKDLNNLIKNLTKEDIIGDVQLITKAINDKTTLSTISYFYKKDYLIGDILESTYEDIDLEFHCFVDLDFRSQQLLKVDDLDVCAEMEYYRSIKVVNNIIYPINGRFNPSLFENLKDVIESVTGGEK